MRHTVTIRMHVRPTAPPWAPGSWQWEVNVQLGGVLGNTMPDRQQAIDAAEAFLADVDAGPAVIVRHYREPT